MHLLLTLRSSGLGYGGSERSTSRDGNVFSRPTKATYTEDSGERGEIGGGGRGRGGVGGGSVEKLRHVNTFITGVTQV